MNKTQITKQTYNKIAKKFDKEYCKTIYYKKQLDNFLKYIKEKSKILDVGCGTGHIARYLLKKGHKVIGVDNSESMLKIARKKAPNCEFKIMDLRYLEFKDESFDIILSLFSLNHVNNQEFEKIIKKFSQILKQDGFLFLALPEGKGEEITEEPLNSKLKIYFNYYKKDFIIDILKESGFKILRIEDRFLKKENQNEFFVSARKNSKSQPA